MRLPSLLAACGLLLALPGDAPALHDVVPLPRHAHAGVHLSAAEGKDGELVVDLGLADEQLRFPVGGVSVTVYEKGPDGKARVVARFSPAVRQKDGLTRTHFTLQRKHALNTTVGLDTEAPWPGGLRVAFALADFVDFGKDVPDVTREELLPFTLGTEDESAVEPGKKVRPHRAP
jgi:hypothetical protein